MCKSAVFVIFMLAVFLSACGQGPQGPKAIKGLLVLRARKAIRGRPALLARRGQKASKDLPARKVLRPTKDHLVRTTRPNKVQAAPA
jgi:hypothetical protein